MNNKLKIFLFLLCWVVICIINLFCTGIIVINKSNEKTDKIPVKKIVLFTNLKVVKQDFENIDKKAKISLNKDGDKLIVKITQGKNKNGAKANFVNLMRYTDYCLMNIEKDIKILDITVKLPDSEIKANLEMDHLVPPDIKRLNTIPYFDENYIKERIY